jgi:SAM-dependent methyltransferase
MTSPRCEACGSADTDAAFVRDGFDHRRCRRCGLVFVHPLPHREQLREAYADAHEPLSAGNWEGSQRHLEPTWASLLGLIEGAAGRGPLLDVGCGGGQFLAFAGQAGWRDALGLEPAPSAAAIARRTARVPIVEAELPDAGLAAGRFAGVVAWDVLEHVGDMPGFLAEVRRVLRPGGVIAIGTVHVGGPAFRVFGRRALVVHPPEHLRYFTPGSLRAALASAGLSVLRLWTQDVYLREWTRLGPKARRSSSAELRTYQHVYPRVVASRVLRGLIVATNVILRATGLGDELVAVARRPVP